MATTTTSKGSARRWGPLWGARPADWALSEDRQVPTYEAALQRVSIEPGDRVLDIGCGVGAFLHLAAGRGGKPHGIDASETLVAFPGRDCQAPISASARWRIFPGPTTRSTSSPASTPSS